MRVRLFHRASAASEAIFPFGPVMKNPKTCGLAGPLAYCVQTARKSMRTIWGLPETKSFFEKTWLEPSLGQ